MSLTGTPNSQDIPHRGKRSTNHPRNGREGEERAKPIIGKIVKCIMPKWGERGKKDKNTTSFKSRGKGGGKKKGSAVSSPHQGEQVATKREVLGKKKREGGLRRREKREHITLPLMQRTGGKEKGGTPKEERSDLGNMSAAEA